MRNISDLIEKYLKDILQENPQKAIEIQRNDLADQFQCVPSQINYVISTRFTIEKGYLVESKRGGGGYIRIQKVSLPQHAQLNEFIFQKIGNSIDQLNAEGILDQLHEGKHITFREMKMLKVVCSREVLAFSLPLRDEIRARILKAMLTVVLTSNKS
ncbi:CtsR family transcriptional regulator [Longirhabdus pacifica]|uniref:CtsR family transcriptional regulator n=1 Tax=Longirhabdus pacifica TaxID=2305227 RepID=UPI001008B460|nr:CtsR family transcriptional regulator [Longirhabdus pacifica]